MNKKVLAVVLVLVIVAVCSVTITVAYFTDLKQTTNVFTVGDIYIKLTESAVKPDGNGNIVADPTQPRIEGNEAGDVFKEHGTMYPGMQVCIDPTVEVTGTESAWIAAKVTVKDGSGGLTQLIGYGDTGGHIDIKMLLSGGFLDQTANVGSFTINDGNQSRVIENVRYNENYALVQIAKPQEGIYEFYFFVREKLAQNETVMFFNLLTIPDEWNSSDVQKLNGLELNVRVYAVQSVGFDTCHAAMEAAFADHFASVFEVAVANP